MKNLPTVKKNNPALTGKVEMEQASSGPAIGPESGGNLAPGNVTINSEVAG
jgi:hypothetical protein